MFIRKHKETNEIVCESDINNFQELDDSDYTIEYTEEILVIKNGKKYKESEIPVLTLAEQQAILQTQYTVFIQAMLDEEAFKLGYTGENGKVEGACHSVCTYDNCGVQKFEDEAIAFKRWRASVWAKGYEILDEVKQGVRTVPTTDELVQLLPSLEIIYTVS
jgi:hypothetical protein